MSKQQQSDNKNNDESKCVINYDTVDDDRKPAAKSNYVFSQQQQHEQQSLNDDNQNNTNFSSDPKLVEKRCTTSTGGGSYTSNSTTTVEESEVFVPNNSSTLTRTTNMNRITQTKSPNQTSSKKSTTNHNISNSTPMTMIYLYIGSTLVGLGIIMVHLIPSIVVYTLLWMSLSTSVMVYYNTIYITNSIQEYYNNTVVHGNGIGIMLLPSSLYSLLTQRTTLHEMLSDDTMVLEYRYILLYFLPLSATQRDMLLQTIAPNHIQQLHQPTTLGTMLLGESFMRIILGYQQYEQLYGNGSNTTTTTTTTTTATTIQNNGDTSNSTVPVNGTAIGPQQSLLLLSDDEGSDLGLDISTDDLIDSDHHHYTIPSIVLNNSSINATIPTAALPNEVITTTTTTTSTSTSTAATTSLLLVPNQSRSASTALRNPIYDDQEYQVLINGLWETFYSTFYNPMIDYTMSRYIIPSIQRIHTLSFYSGVILLSFSTMNFVGLSTYLATYPLMLQRRMFQSQEQLISSERSLSLQHQQERHSNNSNTRIASTTHLLQYPSTMTMSTLILSTTSFGISYFSRRYVRQYYDNISGNTSNNDTPSSIAVDSTKKNSNTSL